MARRTGAERIYDQMKKKKSAESRKITEWIEYWREAGPVRFAEEVLTCPDDVPSYPDWEKLQKTEWCEGCQKEHPKFNERGVPYHLILSDDQRQFLGDLWTGKVSLAIVSAGRGAGKTLALAMWDTWCLCCTPDMDDISALGGSGKQSKLLQKYIKAWRMDVPYIKRCIPISLRGIEPKCINYLNAELNFLPCFTGGTIIYGDNIPIKVVSTENNIINFGANIEKPIKTMTRKYSGEIITVKPLGLFPVEMTPEHPVLVSSIKRKNQWVHDGRYFHYGTNVRTVKISPPEWKMAKELSIKDCLLVPRNIKNPTEDVDDELAWLLGLYLAEGWISKQKKRYKDKIYTYEYVFLSLGKHEKNLQEKALTIIKKHFKSVCISEGKTETATRIIITDKRAVNFFSMCGISSNTKSIPRIIFNIPDDKKRKFIEGYMDGDGYIDKYHIKITTSTRKIVHDMIELLSTFFGIIPHITLREKQFKFQNRNINGKESFSIEWSRNIWSGAKSHRFVIREHNYTYVPIRSITKKNVENIEVYNLETPSGTYCVPFIVHNCSGQSVRGPHVPQVQIDEACEAERASEEGREATDAIWWQIVGKRNTKIIMTSTTHYVFGKFYEYLTHPENYGFMAYKWSIVEHISGKKPEFVYKDKDPSHWKPKVWWLTQDDIVKLRRKASDDEWLCEACGEPSMASGLVFAKEDLDFIECKLCEECYPFKYDEEFKCPLIEKLKLGGMKSNKFDPLFHVYDRKCGFDYGKSAPSATSIIGRKEDILLVLYSDEMRDDRPDEIIQWLERELKEYDVETFIPDPSVAGQEISRIMGDRGYSVWVIGEGEKDDRVIRVQRFVNKHILVVPKAYWKLMTSLRQLSWDKSGKITKYNDHSFDSIQYATEGFDEILEGDISQSTGVFQELLKTKFEKEIPADKSDEFKGLKIWK